MSELLQEAVEQRIAERTARMVMQSLHAMNAVRRWVKPADYMRYYGLSATTLSRKRKMLMSFKAVAGKSKGVVYDIFFNPHLKTFSVVMGGTK